MADLPDWTRAVLLQAKTAAGDIVTILVDAAGQLYALLRGEDAGGDPQTVKVDSDGQLYVVLRGASGEDVLVDADGFLAAIVKGEDSGSVVRNVRVDTSGQIIMVPRGSSGNYMLVDSDGYLTAVLKGLQGGTLTTIGVNAEGQLECFVLDDEDQWGTVIKVGSSELAARLGSPYTWDFRGRVLRIYDFSKGLGDLVTATAGTGGAAALSPDYFQFGGYSVKLTGGSDGDHYAEIRGLAAFPPSFCFGVEAAISFSSTPEYVYIKILAYDGTFVATNHVRYNFATGYIQYFDSNEDWVNEDDIGVYIDAGAFHVFKVLCDFRYPTYEITRQLFDDTEVTAGRTTPDAVDATAPVLKFYVGITSNSGDNDVAYVDRVILTTEVF